MTLGTSIASAISLMELRRLNSRPQGAARETEDFALEISKVGSDYEIRLKRKGEVLKRMPCFFEPSRKPDVNYRFNIIQMRGRKFLWYLT